ncbi:MAG: hypothetical protein ACFYI8_01200 [Candidatus Karelsulcia muelleri]
MFFKKNIYIYIYKKKKKIYDYKLNFLTIKNSNIKNSKTAHKTYIKYNKTYIKYHKTYIKYNKINYSFNNEIIRNNNF